MEPDGKSMRFGVHRHDFPFVSLNDFGIAEQIRGLVMLVFGHAHHRYGNAASFENIQSDIDLDLVAVNDDQIRKCPLRMIQAAE